MLLVCYVLLYVVALCVKMRYVILCIKRLLIDWSWWGAGRRGIDLPTQVLDIEEAKQKTWRASLWAF